MALPAADLLDALQWRYATKAFDPTKKIPTETWDALEQSLILTPSSYGMQPWKFLVITNQQLRESLVPHSWNQRQVADASHLLVLTVKTTITETDIDSFIHRMIEVRGGSPDSLLRFRQMLVDDLVEGSRNRVPKEWAARQAYIALGQFMTAAALLNIDTCPMEGFSADQFDEILGLKDQGYTSTLLCPAGYRSENDRYAHLPKVRFKHQDVIQHLP